MNIQNFAKEWNSAHRDEKVIISSPSEPITTIYLRYTGIKKIIAMDWEDVLESISNSSHATMFVTSTKEMAERGIVDISISSMNHNFKESYIIGTIETIYDSFREET